MDLDLECESCGTSYPKEDFEKLELTGHNGIWNFDYRRCRECGGEITGYLEARKNASQEVKKKMEERKYGNGKRTGI